VSEIVWAILFWLSVGLIIHSFVFYPLSLRLFPIRFKSPEANDKFQPSIAILIPARNEEVVIEEKIRNSLALNYPAEKIEVLVGSDNSTDSTDRLVRECTDPRVKLHRFEGRNGKPKIMNSLVENTNAEILLLTDANVTIWGDFSRFMRHFQDESVVAVGAANRFVPRDCNDKMAKGEQAYRTFIESTKRLETGIGGFSGLDGAAYAIRRSAWKPLPPTAMNDDIVSSYSAVINGQRVVFEPALVGMEHTGISVGSEYRRRIRIGTLNWGTLVSYPGFLLPTRPIVAYTYFSHKAILWLLPVLMIVALLTNALLCQYSNVYLALFVAQLTFYIAGALGGLASAFGVKILIFYQVFSFVAVMTAFLIGGVRFFLGHSSAVWERSER